MYAWESSEACEHRDEKKAQIIWHGLDTEGTGTGENTSLLLPGGAVDASCD